MTGRCKRTAVAVGVVGTLLLVVSLGIAEAYETGIYCDLTGHTHCKKECFETGPMYNPDTGERWQSEEADPNQTELYFCKPSSVQTDECPTWYVTCGVVWRWSEPHCVGQITGWKPERDNTCH
jgi:hypothetical protein